MHAGVILSIVNVFYRLALSSSLKRYITQLSYITLAHSAQPLVCKASGPSCYITIKQYLPGVILLIHFVRIHGHIHGWGAIDTRVMDAPPNPTLQL